MLKKTVLTIIGGLLGFCALNATAETVEQAIPVNTTEQSTEVGQPAASTTTGQTGLTEKTEPKKEPGYTIVFDKGTKKKPEISNKLVKVQLYKFDKPYKKVEVKTDDTGQVILEKEKIDNLGIDLFYIEGQEKLKVKCNGYALPGKTNINVRCE